MLKPIFVLTLSDIVGLGIWTLIIVGCVVWFVGACIADWFAKRKRAKK